MARASHNHCVSVFCYWQGTTMDEGQKGFQFENLDKRVQCHSSDFESLFMCWGEFEDFFSELKES